MKNKLHYSPESLRDLDNIWDYIALQLQNPSAAQSVVRNILDEVDLLESFAELGASLSSIADVKTEHRFLVCGSYMVFYRARGSSVYIDRILYGRSHYMNILFKELPQEETNE